MKTRGFNKCSTIKNLIYVSYNSYNGNFMITVILLVLFERINFGHCNVLGGLKDIKTW